jgi:hypothetical protein
VIYATDCPILLISPQQLHRQSKAKCHENYCFTTEENTATLFHGRDTFTCDYHPKNKIPTLCCITDIQFNVIYFNWAFSKLFVSKEGNRTLSTMPADKSWVMDQLSHSCSPSKSPLDIAVNSRSVGFCVIQV